MAKISLSVHKIGFVLTFYILVMGGKDNIWDQTWTETGEQESVDTPE